MSPPQVATNTKVELSAPELKGLAGIRAEKKPRSGQKVWIDLENSPHIPFFVPIITELEGRSRAHRKGLLPGL
jgi:hypothetical protein